MLDLLNVRCHRTKPRWLWTPARDHARSLRTSQALLPGSIRFHTKTQLETRNRLKKTNVKFQFSFPTWRILHFVPPENHSKANPTHTPSVRTLKGSHGNGVGGTRPRCPRYIRKTNFKTKTVKEKPCKTSVFIPNMAHCTFLRTRRPPRAHPTHTPSVRTLTGSHGNGVGATRPRCPSNIYIYIYEKTTSRRKT